jgi:hypothetical protein
MPAHHTSRSARRHRAFLLAAVLLLGASWSVTQPPTALAAAPALAPIPITRAACLPPSPSFCASGYVTATGTFTPSSFRVDGDALVLAGTFTGTVEFFGSTYTLTEQTASLPIDHVTVSANAVVIKTVLTQHGPYMPDGPVGNVTAVNMPFEDPTRSGLGFQTADVQWISATAKPHRALGLLAAWFWSQAAGDLERESEVLNWLLFPR